MPLRVPAAALPAAEEAVDAVAEEAEPPQAVRAAAAATVPQTARNERRVIFFIVFSSGPGTRPASLIVLLWERPYCSAFPPEAATIHGQNAGKTLGAGPGFCKELVNCGENRSTFLYIAGKTAQNHPSAPGQNDKKPRALFPECPGQRFFYQFMGLILVATYLPSRFTRYSTPGMPLMVMVSTATAPFWYW